MPTIISLIFAVYIIGAGLVLWSAFRTKPASESRPGFRLAYVILPLLVFLFSIAITVFFYPKLPAELAYSFKSGASPDSHFSTSAAPALILGLQLLFALPLVGITLLISRLTKENRSATLEKTLLLMGNIAALPQLIVCFALTDIFSYNSYGSHLMPLWLFAVILLVSGAAFLGILFTGALKQRAAVK